MAWLKNVFYIAIAVSLIFLSACSSASGAVPPTTGPAGTEPSIANPPQAVLDAQTWLAGQLGVSAEETKLVDIQHTDWPDSCLGLGGANESCAQVITPGWKVVVEVAGKQYEVRASDDGTVIKLVPS